jgi:CBS domain-containing protein
VTKRYNKRYSDVDVVRNPVMKVRDVMTPHVVSVTPDESVFVAARLMLQKKISGLPVVDGLGNLVGVVTEGNFLRRAETGAKRERPKWVEFFIGPGRLANEYVHFSGRKVRDVMTYNVWTVTLDASLAEVVHLMERHNIKRIPVVEANKIVGIVTRLVSSMRSPRLPLKTRRYASNCLLFWKRSRGRLQSTLQ